MYFGEQGTLIDSLKSQLNAHLDKCVADSEEVWEELRDEQAMCMQIGAKQIFVSDRFSHFHDMWMARDASEENIEQFHRFTEVEEEVFQLNNILSTFETKLEKTATILEEVNDRFNNGLKEVIQIRNTINNSTDALELTRIRFPDFLRLKLKSPSYNDPLDLNEEWNYLDIDNKITACLIEMDSILNS